MHRFKSRKISTIVIFVLVCLPLSGGLAGIAVPTIPDVAGKIEVNLNLGAEPLTLDPALATDTTSHTVIEQLFAGMFDVDDTTGALVPDLATGYEVNPGATVYTVTLQSSLVWSDGMPLTADDVHYAILRTLAPATGSGSAYILDPILNALAYREGNLSDPNQVGVHVIDSTHLRFDLEYPAAYFPYILASHVARPVPEHIVLTWGDTWTDENHIVTSGAYLLTGYVPGDEISLRKNLIFHQVGEVQIDEVTYFMEGDEAVYWPWYLNDELDSSAVPNSQIAAVRADPLISQEYYSAPSGCTYYYGFINNKPPFDDPRVRKAFIMASDRVGLVNTVFGDGRQPALHFTPPQIFGSPAPGTVGLDYNPAGAQAQLQSYLTEQEMNLADLQAMDITLLYNTSSGHAAIADFMQDSWYNTLGISVTVEDQDWSIMLDTIQTSTPLADMPHIYRMGWCGDYPDANNFIHDLFNNQVGPNRMRRGCLDDTCTITLPLYFDALTEQALSETDPASRAAIYAQAEEELAEVEAAYLPIYWYASAQVTKPYLERTYPALGPYDLADWRILETSATIPVSGGALSSNDEMVLVEIPGDTFASTTVISYTPATAMMPGGDLLGLDRVFELDAVDASTGLEVQPQPGTTYTLTVTYTDGSPVIESSLQLYYWDNEVWNVEGTSVVNALANTVTATPDHLSIWALFGETRRVFIPHLLR